MTWGTLNAAGEWISSQLSRQTTAGARPMTMFKKILIGLLAVALLCAIARSGYEFGKHLANNDKAAAQQTAQSTAQR